MNDETMILCVHFDFADGHEYLMYRIRQADLAAVQATVKWIQEHWRQMSEDEFFLTYEDAIDRDLKEARIWFQKEEYDVVYIDYYN